MTDNGNNRQWGMTKNGERQTMQNGRQLEMMHYGLMTDNGSNRQCGMINNGERRQWGMADNWK